MKRRLRREECAYHEAGHAALVLYFGWTLLVVKLNMTTYVRPPLNSEAITDKAIQVLMAGCVALKLYKKWWTFDSAWQHGGADDLHQIYQLRIGLAAYPAMFAEHQRQTAKLVRSIWPDVKRIADKLMIDGLFLPEQAQAG